MSLAASDRRVFFRQRGFDLYLYIGLQPVGLFVAVLFWMALGGPSQPISFLGLAMYSPVAAGLVAYYYVQPFSAATSSEGIELRRRYGTAWIPWSNFAPSAHPPFLGQATVFDSSTKHRYQLNAELAAAVFRDMRTRGIATSPTLAGVSG